MTDQREQVYAALRQADAAGDAQGAQRLATYLQSLPAAPAVHTYRAGPKGPTFQLPENASDADVRAAAMRATNGDARFSRSAVDRGASRSAALSDQRPKSFTQGVAEGFTNVWNHAADWTESGLDAVGNAVGLGNVGHAINSIGPSLGMAGSVADAEQQQARDFGSSPTQGSGVGQFVGETIGLAPLASVPGGAMVQGGAGGALMSDAHSPGGVLVDTAKGVVAGKLGEMGFRALSRVAAPLVNPLVRRLAAEGVQLTPGQIAGAPSINGGPVSAAGRAMRRAEDVVSGVPVAGAGVNAAQRRGVVSLNIAAVNRSLRPIGERLAASIPAGHDAIRHAGDRLGAAYADVLPKLNGQADNTFATRLRAIVKRADLPPGYEAQAQAVINEALKAFRPSYRVSGAPRLSAPEAPLPSGALRISPPSGAVVERPNSAVSTDASVNGIDSNTAPTFSQFTDPGIRLDWRYTGRRLRDASERLGDLGSAFRASDDPYKRILGDIAQQARDQLHSLARRGNPVHAGRLRDIDRGYASLVRVERAATGTPDGIFSPRQYDAAVRGADRSARRRQSARGRALDQDLSSAASQVMADTAAQGGSRDVNTLMALGVLGSRAMAGDPYAIGGLGTVVSGSAAYSRVGQRAITGLMTRTPSLQAQGLANLLRYGGRAAPILTTSGLAQAGQ